MRAECITPEDRREFAEMYGALRRFASVLAAPGFDADDLVQEALVRVLRRGRLAEIDHPAAYLRRVIWNLATKSRMRAGIERRAIARYRAGDRSAEVDRYPSDLAEILRLPRETRAVLYLAEVEGYRFEEIADMVGCTPSAARKRASRARRRLRTALAGEVG